MRFRVIKYLLNGIIYCIKYKRICIPMKSFCISVYKLRVIYPIFTSKDIQITWSNQMVTKVQKKKISDLQIIAASFTGINGILTSFPHLVPAGTLKEVFRLLVLCCNPNVRLIMQDILFSIIINKSLFKSKI